MRFIKTAAGETMARALRPVTILRPITDDETGTYRNKYFLYHIDDGGHIHDIGEIKIGRSSQLILSGGDNDPFYPHVEDLFNSLTGDYFSLGQSESYYEDLMALGIATAQRILKDLRDCAYDLAIFDKYRNETVMTSSLLARISERNIRNRYHRLTHNNAKLTPFDFRYSFPLVSDYPASKPPCIEFNVEPQSLPPTNVHVLIGRNGVGKTVCMQSIAKSLLGISGDTPTAATGHIELLGENRNEWAFSGLVWVSFSIFDDFDLPPPARLNMNATTIGLRQSKEGSTENLIKDTRRLSVDFCESFKACRRGPRRQRWADAIKTLSSDVMFNDVGAMSLLQFNEKQWEEQATSFFEQLSSGHKIVLLTMTRLVEAVEEKTIVLIDEPETHLHPPLLSAFIRALADLLLLRNAIAIIATHSPVVLQEVPASCVSILNRKGPLTSVQRPRIATFGENVGILTTEVFRLDVTDAGFHQLLLKSVTGNRDNFGKIAEKFSGELGGEARSILNGMVFHRDDA
jgi:predicted ATPase